MYLLFSFIFPIMSLLCHYYFAIISPLIPIGFPIIPCFSIFFPCYFPISLLFTYRFPYCVPIISLVFPDYFPVSSLFFPYYFH